MFFHGEDAVADDLAPFIDAAPREEQKYFLTTQQVDEARHSVFFHRFMHEVVERGDGTIAGALPATEPELTWGFRRTFEMLDEVTGVLRKDRSRTALARAVTMYHFIVEATLAQPGQHFIGDYLERRELLPGFREGMQHVAQDELRSVLGSGDDSIRADPQHTGGERRVREPPVRADVGRDDRVVPEFRVPPGHGAGEPVARDGIGEKCHRSAVRGPVDPVTHAILSGDREPGGRMPREQPLERVSGRARGEREHRGRLPRASPPVGGDARAPGRSRR